MNIEGFFLRVPIAVLVKFPNNRSTFLKKFSSYKYNTRNIYNHYVPGTSVLHVLSYLILTKKQILLYPFQVIIKNNIMTPIFTF